MRVMKRTGSVAHKGGYSQVVVNADLFQDEVTSVEAEGHGDGRNKQTEDDGSDDGWDHGVGGAGRRER